MKKSLNVQQPKLEREVVSSTSQVRPEISLAGLWSFSLDSEDRGISERWWQHELDDSAHLPGSLQAQGFGNPVSVDTPWTGQIVDRSWFTDPRYERFRQPGNVKVPFWLQPERHYIGPAWYQRTIDIPAAWSGRRITLNLERAHIETTVWLDDQRLGSCNSLSTPHVYELGLDISSGRHRLTIRVDNRLTVDVGPNSHSVSDHTQTNWNGIIGRIEMMATAPVWIEDVQAFPSIADRSVKVRVKIGNATGIPGEGSLTVGEKTLQASWDEKGGEAEVVVPLDSKAELWDEFTPRLHRIDVRLGEDLQAIHFGLREVTVVGTQIAINGRPVFLRGTLECCVFPLTGYPPTDLDCWRKIIATCQSNGFNHVRFHSWCPPKAAFIAADELGVYLQIECASWANTTTGLGMGEPIDQWLYEEGRRICQTFGNHPSFVLMAYGNEPGGDEPKRDAYLARWLEYWKEHEPRRLHTGGAGWPAISENQYHNVPEPRIHAWGAGLNSRINAQPPETCADYTKHVADARIPIVTHEIGQWCVYPDFDEIVKYTGLLKARNFEIVEETLAENHMADQAHEFLIASGKLQMICYKEEIEAALRTNGLGGFQVLQLNDFPGQGTALVGWLNPFWEEKGYISASQVRRFCGPTIPLARLPKRIWSSDETFNAILEVAHFGPDDLQPGGWNWSLLDQHRVVLASGDFGDLHVSTGTNTRLGSIHLSLATFDAPAKLNLVVKHEQLPVTNDWDMWIYPQHPTIEVPNDLAITNTIDASTMARLHRGDKVLFLPERDLVDRGVAIGFSSVFWNTAWTRGQAPHTLGLLCDPTHPLFASFPTESHSNWQWWELLHGAAAMVLDGLPPNLRPLVQPIDTWFENRRLGLLLEAHVGNGKLIICSMDIQNSLDTRPVTRQFRRSLLTYMASETFAPAEAMNFEHINAICNQKLTHV